jgi:DNA-binding MarR family transcriptional regulator
MPPVKASPRIAAAAPDKQRLRLWLKLFRTSRAIEAELRARLHRTFKVSLPRFDVMAALARVPDGQTMTALSRFLVVTNGNVTAMIDGLVADGLVIRVPDAADRRATFVRLTPAGTRQFEQMATAHNDWIEELLGALGPHEIEQLAGLLDHTRVPTARTGESP